MCGSDHARFSRAETKYFVGATEIPLTQIREVSQVEYARLFPHRKDGYTRNSGAKREKLDDRAFWTDTKLRDMYTESAEQYLESPAKIWDKMRREIAAAGGADAWVSKQVEDWPRRVGGNKFLVTASSPAQAIDRVVKWERKEKQTMCGAKCRGARGPACDCICEGQFHGVSVGMSRARFAAEDLDLRPTAEMAANAERGLALREEHGKGGTAVGVARARDIKNRANLSPDTVKRMHSFFSRHEGNQKGGEDDAGYIAWLLWGGDAGKAWAARKAAQIDKAKIERFSMPKVNYEEFRAMGYSYGQRAQQRGVRRIVDDKEYTKALSVRLSGLGIRWDDAAGVRAHKVADEAWSKGWHAAMFEEAENPPKFAVGEPVGWNIGTRIVQGSVARVNRLAKPEPEYIVDLTDTTSGRKRLNIPESSLVKMSRSSHNIATLTAKRWENIDKSPIAPAQSDKDTNMKNKIVHDFHDGWVVVAKHDGRTGGEMRAKGGFAKTAAQPWWKPLKTGYWVDVYRGDTHIAYGPLVYLTASKGVVSVGSSWNAPHNEVTILPTDRVEVVRKASPAEAKAAGIRLYNARKAGFARKPTPNKDRFSMTYDEAEYQIALAEERIDSRGWRNPEQVLAWTRRANAAMRRADAGDQRAKAEIIQIATTLKNLYASQHSRPGTKSAFGNGETNRRLLQVLGSADYRIAQQVVKNIASHYGINDVAVYEELFSPDAEHLMDYLTEPVRSAAAVILKRKGIMSRSGGKMAFAANNVDLWNYFARSDFTMIRHNPTELANYERFAKKAMGMADFTPPARQGAGPSLHQMAQEALADIAKYKEAVYRHKNRAPWDTYGRPGAKARLSLIPLSKMREMKKHYEEYLRYVARNPDAKDHGKPMSFNQFVDEWTDSHELGKADPMHYDRSGAKSTYAAEVVKKLSGGWVIEREGGVLYLAKGSEAIPVPSVEKAIELHKASSEGRLVRRTGGFMSRPGTKSAFAHPSWHEGFLGKDTAPALAAYSWIDRSNVPVQGRSQMLLADLAAGVHATSPNLSIEQAVLAAAKDMVRKGVATRDLREWAANGGKFSRPGASEAFALGRVSNAATPQADEALIALAAQVGREHTVSLFKRWAEGKAAMSRGDAKAKFSGGNYYTVAVHIGNNPAGERTFQDLAEAKAHAKVMLDSAKAGARGKPVVVDVYPVVNYSPQAAVLTLKA